MRGNMKLGKKGNYVVNIILVACVYAVIFALCKLDVKDYAKSYQDIEELLCAVSGFRMTDLPMDIQGQMIKWMLSLSVVYILVGRDIYDPLNHLKYIAMVRYGSYRRFYQTLMNKTVVNTLLYGVCGVGITYVLYLLGGNGQVSAAVFIKMSMIYILQLILLCLVQTVCMILFSGYTASVLVLISWFVLVLCGSFLAGAHWQWLPANWGMYMRRAEMTEGGVTVTSYYIEGILCVLLWIVVPRIVKREK